MQVLTTQGYKPIEDIVSSDNLIAYDVYTGNQIINHLIYKQKWQEYDFYGTASIIYDEWDENNNLTKTNIIIPDRSWQFYRINDTWTLYCQESIWANGGVVHVSQLKIGDIIYDENDNDIIITDIQPVTSSEWWRIRITGDSSYIADGLTLHNPSRYWIGGGSSTNFNATANTNWSATSGGTVTASVPTASDDIFFDGSGSRAQDNCNLNASQTVTNVTFGSEYSGSFILADVTNNALTYAGTFICTTNNNFVNNTTSVTQLRGLSPGASSNTIATGGKTLPFTVRINAGTTLTVSGSDLRIEHPTLTGSTSIGGIHYPNNSTVSILNRFSNERVITAGLTQGSSTAGTPSASIEIYVIGGRISQGLGQGNTAIFTQGLFISGTYATVFPQIVNTAGSTITYITGAIAQSGLLIGTNTQVNTPGMVWDNVAFTNIQPGTARLTITSSFTASNITNRGSDVGLSTVNNNNTNLTFAGSGGFICNNFIYTGTTNRTITLQAGNTYIVTGSLNIGTQAGATFLNIITSGSGGAGIARPKLILREGATCAVIANFTQIDASDGRPINTFAGTLTNTTNIRSFTDLTTAAYSSIG